jgi:DNA methyltransferase 1-associated protein 1
MADVRDILDLEQPATPEVTKELVLNQKKKASIERYLKKLKKKNLCFIMTSNLYSRPKSTKRPEGMHREVFALLYNDNKDCPPLMPVETGKIRKSHTIT